MTENYIKNKKLCEISRNIPFLESYNCKRERFSEDDLNEVIEKKNTLEEARDKISGFFSSLVPNDKVTYDPSNLIIILFIVIVILIYSVIMLTTSKKKVDLNGMLKLYEFPIPPPPPPPPVNFIMSNEIAPKLS